MSGWTLEYYETGAGRSPVAEYLDGLDERDADTVTRRLDLLKEFGTGLGAPYVKHLRGKLWELRARGRVQHRILYFTVRGQTIVLLHAFVKKTQTTPEQEITTALNRLSDYERRTPCSTRSTWPSARPVIPRSGRPVRPRSRSTSSSAP